MQWDGVLVRFGEIGIKSPPVRRRMLAKLRQNLLDGMVRHNVEGDAHVQGARLWMHGPDADALARVAQRTFGVVSASPAVICEPTIEAVGGVACEAAMEREWTSFAIRANREGQHDFSSTDVGIQVGSAVFKAAQAAGRSPKVDLGSPDLEVFADVRQDRAFVYTDVIRGPGGLPSGVQGKALCLVSDPASFVAAWLMMRRGAKLVLVHAGTTGSLPVENLEALRDWGGPDRIDLTPVCTGFVSKQALLDVAGELARRTGADAVVLGDTLDSDLDVSCTASILRPVCGLAPAVIESYRQKISLDDDEPEHIFDASSHETQESLLSMHRISEW